MLEQCRRFLNENATLRALSHAGSQLRSGYCQPSDVTPPSQAVRRNGSVAAYGCSTKVTRRSVGIRAGIRRIRQLRMTLRRKRAGPRPDQGERTPTPHRARPIRRTRRHGTSAGRAFAPRLPRGIQHSAHPMGCAEKTSERADKPGSVVDSHSSGRSVAAALKQPTRMRRGQRHCIPIRSCSRWGLPCHAALAPHAVRSYRTLSPLPVRSHCSALLRAPRAPSAVCSLLHFPSAHAAQALPGTLPYGARTFLHLPGTAHGAKRLA